VSIRISSTDGISDDLRVGIEAALDLFNSYRIVSPERPE